MKKAVSNLIRLISIDIVIFIGLSMMSAILYFGFLFANNILIHNTYHSEIESYSNVKKISLHDITSKHISTDTFLIKGKGNQNKIVSFFSSKKPINSEKVTYYITKETGLFSKHGYTSKQEYQKEFTEIKKEWTDNKQENVRFAIKHTISSMYFFAFIIILFNLFCAFCTMCIKFKNIYLKQN